MPEIVFSNFPKFQDSSWSRIPGSYFPKFAWAVALIFVKNDIISTTEGMNTWTNIIIGRPTSVAVWCEFWAGSIKGPSSFNNDVGYAITSNSEHNRLTISNFLLPKLNDFDTNDI